MNCFKLVGRLFLLQIFCFKKTIADKGFGDESQPEE